MSAKPRFLILLSIAAAGLVAGAHAAPSANAASDPYMGSVTVRLADLDLSADSGARVALRRIGWAADEICGRSPQIAALDRMRIYRACMRDAVDHAVASLGAPAVTALNAGRAVPAHDLTASR